MSSESNKSHKSIQETEIDFINLARTFWEGRFIIGKFIICGVAIGFFVALLTPNQFTASSTMVPLISDPKSKLAGLSGLAAMAGVNLSSTAGSELSPKSYSRIISSVPFQLELMKTSLNFEKLDSQITLYDYYTRIKKGNPFKKYTLGLPNLIIKTIKREKKTLFIKSEDNPLFLLTEKQIEVQKIIETQVGILISDADGDVSISCSLPEAYAAAQLAQNAQSLLQKYITEFKVEKAKSNQEFIQQRYDEAKKNYKAIQKQLASLRDHNKNVSTSIAKTEEEQLTGEYTLVSGIYSELAKNLEQAKIQVKEETPVFTIIKPVSVPTEKSSPNRPLILVISAFAGLFIGSVWVLSKIYMVQTRNKWIEDNNQKKH